MKGSQKQIAWAQVLYNRLYAGYQCIEAKLATEEADAWKGAYEYGQRLLDIYSKETLSWVLIDDLKKLSVDPEKCAKQIRYMYYKNLKLYEQKAED